ncbi:MAG: ergothioneine biosynthesis protein EgtB [Lamprobacter sp.]|uniref:ergothioneine biosynthesis protein EgtB n=1 Tax=Lamprobacter sp. TaxID=3100796 RepID=UPI002B25BA9D|nr:ergothioneine biosynthesis protein EgtB [Lamprobacter sp.]MEA3639373.1 ergothioneine biosynthesis protein EgtB [Lamprobacter sp.]
MPLTDDLNSLSAAYRRVRAFTEQLCEPLEIEDYMLQAAVEASPAKWHLAHVSWFFETFLLKPFLPGYAVFHPRFDYLFNSYYEQTEAGFWPRPERGLISRPTVSEVYAYRHQVDEAMLRLLADCPAEHAETLQARLAIGLNHEQQHQELLVTDIKYNLAHNPLRPAYRADLPTAPVRAPVPLTFTAFEGGVHSFGAQPEGQGDSNPSSPAPSFAYDNEFPRHQRLLEPFRLADRLVTNAEYLDFIEDGGYQHPGLWLSDGWAQIKTQGWQAPLYWEQLDAVWHETTLGGRRPLNPAEPVCHLSYFEAEAYARWAGRRLPTEFEWEHAAADRAVEGHFVDAARLHPTPAGKGALQQLFGDCWEWTASAYLPYPRYRAVEGALGEYNGKFMSGQMVLRGGSCATSRDHARATYRNFFYPHERWQFKGIRLAEDLA